MVYLRITRKEKNSEVIFAVCMPSHVNVMLKLSHALHRTTGDLNVSLIYVIKSGELLLKVWVKLELHIKVNNINYCVLAKTKI